MCIYVVYVCVCFFVPGVCFCVVCTCISAKLVYTYADRLSSYNRLTTDEGQHVARFWITFKNDFLKLSFQMNRRVFERYTVCQSPVCNK